MAQVIKSGVPFRPLIADAIQGLNLAFVSPSSVSIGGGNARSSDDTHNISVSTPLTVDLTTSGAGGLDTGAEAPDTFYFVYVIFDTNGANPVAGLLSVSSSSPTLPVGYNKFRRIGTVRNNSSSDIIPFSQFGDTNDREMYYNGPVGARNVLTGGAALVVTAVDLSAFMPPTSRLAYMEWRQNGTPFLLVYTDPASPGTDNYIGILAGNDIIAWMPTSAAQQVAYLNFGGGGNADAWLIGYKEAV
ncbi:MAG: hypothetical protein ACE5Q6_07635 [Dehalococcoidia bacterium]